MIQNYVSVVKPKQALYKAWVPIMVVTQATKALPSLGSSLSACTGLRTKNEF